MPALPPLPRAAPAQPLAGLALGAEADPGVHDSGRPGSAAPLPPHFPPPVTPPGRPTVPREGQTASGLKRGRPHEAGFRNEKRCSLGLCVFALVSGRASPGRGAGRPYLPSTPPPARSPLNILGQGRGLRAWGGARRRRRDLAEAAEMGFLDPTLGGVEQDTPHTRPIQYRALGAKEVYGSRSHHLIPVGP